jgi:hypothetical protein
MGMCYLVLHEVGLAVVMQSEGNITIVAYLLKTRTVEPEKQLLLANGSETTFISRQWL